jgi:hypothetical protein
VNEPHLKIRAVADAGRKWGFDLEDVHRFTDKQACVVVSLMASLLQKDKSELPPSDDPLMLHPKEGWKYMKEAKRLAGL